MKAIVEQDCKAAFDGVNVIALSKGQELTGENAEKAIKWGIAQEPKSEPKPAKKKTPKPEVTKPAEPDHEG